MAVGHLSLQGEEHELSNCKQLAVQETCH